jgi:hypothetical protein
VLSEKAEENPIGTVSVLEKSMALTHNLLIPTEERRKCAKAEFKIASN